MKAAAPTLADTTTRMKAFVGFVRSHVKGNEKGEPSGNHGARSGTRPPSRTRAGRWWRRCWSWHGRSRVTTTGVHRQGGAILAGGE